jgi:hypothetical protein
LLAATADLADRRMDDLEHEPVQLRCCPDSIGRPQFDT